MKRNIIKWIKFYLLAVMMSLGFYVSYAFVWCVLGFELTTLVLYILAALGLLSELAYIKWVSR